jgi:acyl-CoA thioester hydrolase
MAEDGGLVPAAGHGAGPDTSGRIGPTFVGTVYPYQLDHMGHVNVQFYVGLFDQASWGFFTWMGLNAARIARERVGMAALVQENRFHAELHPGESLEVWTRVLAISRQTVRYQHEMFRRDDETLVASSELVAACLDLDSRRARPLPDDIRERLRGVVRAAPVTAEEFGLDESQRRQS